MTSEEFVGCGLGVLHIGIGLIIPSYFLLAFGCFVIWVIWIVSHGSRSK